MLEETAHWLLTGHDTGLIAPQLQVIVDALTAMHRPNSGLVWIRHPTSSLFCASWPATQPSPTRYSTSCRQVGQLTTSEVFWSKHGALPSRDERLANFQSGASMAKRRITTEEHRKVVTRFIRWNLEKRLRSMNPVTESAFLRAKQTVTVTIDFCNWLAAENGTTVDHVTQAHIDLWQSTGPTTREHITVSSDGPLRPGCNARS